MALTLQEMVVIRFWHLHVLVICSAEATEDKSSFISLDALMELHQKRHHASAVRQPFSNCFVEFVYHCFAVWHGSVWFLWGRAGNRIELPYILSHDCIVSFIDLCWASIILSFIIRWALWFNQSQALISVKMPWPRLFCEDLYNFFKQSDIELEWDGFMSNNYK